MPGIRRFFEPLCRDVLKPYCEASRVAITSNSVYAAVPRKSVLILFCHIKDP